jgi:hypothetical protein
MAIPMTPYNPTGQTLKGNGRMISEARAFRASFRRTTPKAASATGIVNALALLDAAQRVELCTLPSITTNGQVVIRGNQGTTLPLSGNVLVTGLLSDGTTPATDTLALNGNNMTTGVNTFSKITQIQMPVQSNTDGSGVGGCDIVTLSVMGNNNATQFSLGNLVTTYLPGTFLDVPRGLSITGSAGIRGEVIVNGYDAGQGIVQSIVNNANLPAVKQVATLTLTAVIATNVVTINGVTFTAIASNAIPASNSQFCIGASDTATAANLAAAIGVNFPYSVVATSSGNVVVILSITTVSAILVTSPSSTIATTINSLVEGETIALNGTATVLGAHAFSSVTDLTLPSLSAKLTLTLNTVIAGNIVTVNGVTFTCVADGATDNQFNVGVSDTFTAASLAAAISAALPGVVATGALAVVTLASSDGQSPIAITAASTTITETVATSGTVSLGWSNILGMFTLSRYGTIVANAYVVAPSVNPLIPSTYTLETTAPTVTFNPLILSLNTILFNTSLTGAISVEALYDVIV